MDAEVAKNLVAPVIGEANLAAYKAGFNDSKSDQATRISFKVRIHVLPDKTNFIQSDCTYILPPSLNI